MPAVRNRRDPRYLRDHPVAPEPETPDLDAFAQDVRIYLEARNAYLAGERRRGRELLTLRGAAGEAVAAAARAAVAEMVSGDEVAKNRGEVAAKDVEK